MRSTSHGDSVALIGGSVINGVAAYAFIAVGTRTFGAEEFAPIAILWSLWALAVAVVTFPVQHWTIRTIRVGGGEGAVLGAIPVIVGLVASLAAVVGIATYLSADRLFGDPGAFYPICAAVVVVTSGILGLSRGVLSGRNRFRSAAVVVGGENLIRLGLAIIVVAVAGSVEWYASTLIFGVLIIGLFPSSLRLVGSVASSHRMVAAAIGGIAGGTLIAQVILTGLPVAAALLGAPDPVVTAVFTTSAVLRAPYLIALGLALRSTARLSTTAMTRPGALRRELRAVALVSVGIAVVGGLVGMLVGPTLIRLLFGPESALPGMETGLIVAGSVLALSGLYYSLVLIAVDRTAVITVSWVIALICALIVGTSGGPIVRRVSLAFAVAETVAAVLLGAWAARGTGGAVGVEADA